MGRGYLLVKTVTANGAVLVGNVSITVSNEKNERLYELVTNESGVADEVALEAPDRTVIDDPFAPEPPWTTYNLLVRAEGYTTIAYKGVMISDMSTSSLEINMEPVVIGQEQAIKYRYIGGHKLYQTETPQQVQDIPTNDGFIGIIPRILPEVTIPNNIRVQLGNMDDPPNIVTVPFIHYIKNVAAHEIYDTWHEQALTANIYCIVSLTLNRVYTEFYRKRGFNFNITSTPKMDQMYVHGGITKPRIDVIVDRIFNYYLAIIGHKEPFLSLYNDGIVSNLPGRLSQHGSQALALRGFTAWQIIKHYYPQNLELRICEQFGGVLESYPGYTLREGARGDAVRTMQLFLNRILGRYTDLYIINPVDGIFGPQTRRSVAYFQGLWSLPQTGEIDRRTWYEIGRLYGIERRLWEMDSEGQRIGIGTTPPTQVLKFGDVSSLVVELQFLLDFIAQYHSEIPFVPQIRRFDRLTEEGVKAFQRLFGITVDGIVGSVTWRLLYDVYWGIRQNAVPPPPPPPPDPDLTPDVPAFPGTLSFGSSGPNVLLIQRAINRVAEIMPGLWRIAEDGQFGSGTRDAVMAFQRIFGLTVDGIVGPNTWNRLMQEAYSPGGITPPPEIPPFPGNLSVGSSGQNVRLVQEAFNTLAPCHPGRFWILTVDSQFGNMTRDAIFSFQSVFGMPITGIVNQATWERLMQEAVNVAANGCGGGGTPQIPPFPGNLSVGSSGSNVRLVQEAFNTLAPCHPGRFWILTVDSQFGNMTRDAIFSFQGVFGMPITGIVNQATWERLMQEAANVSANGCGGGGGGTPQIPPFPGDLGVSSSGQNVQLVQEAFNTLAPCHPGRFWILTVDSQFGNMTRDAIFSFQSVFGMPITGIVNQVTWERLMQEAANVSANGCGGGGRVFTVVLDPGHGGWHPGATNGNRQEKTDNLNMGLAVRQRLLALAPAQNVIMTRSTDIYLELSERAAISNQNNADIFVSIHRDYNDNPAVNGVWTFIQEGSPPIDRTYAQTVQNEIVNVGVQTNLGVRYANFQVLRETLAPSMLIELGFITNAIDNQLFDQHFNAYAGAIARGILKALGVTPSGSTMNGFIDIPFN